MIIFQRAIIKIFSVEIGEVRMNVWGAFNNGFIFYVDNDVAGLLILK